MRAIGLKLWIKVEESLYFVVKTMVCLSRVITGQLICSFVSQSMIVHIYKSKL